MTLASLGWGSWWVALFVHHFFPGIVDGFGLTSVVSTSFALFGLGISVLTLRGQRSWLLFVLIPIFANASLLFLPWMVLDLLDAQG